MICSPKSIANTLNVYHANHGTSDNEIGASLEVPVRQFPIDASVRLVAHSEVVIERHSPYARAMNERQGGGAEFPFVVGDTASDILRTDSIQLLRRDSMFSYTSYRERAIFVYEYIQEPKFAATEDTDRLHDYGADSLSKIDTTMNMST